MKDIIQLHEDILLEHYTIRLFYSLFLNDRNKLYNNIVIFKYNDWVYDEKINEVICDDEIIDYLYDKIEYEEKDRLILEYNQEKIKKILGEI